jgi:hypothetical protein
MSYALRFPLAEVLELAEHAATGGFDTITSHLHPGQIAVGVTRREPAPAGG